MDVGLPIARVADDNRIAIYLSIFIVVRNRCESCEIAGVSLFILDYYGARGIFLLEKSCLFLLKSFFNS